MPLASFSPHGRSMMDTEAPMRRIVVTLMQDGTPYETIEFAGA